MKKLFIVAAVFALLNVFTTPAQALDFKVVKNLTTPQSAPTQPNIRVIDSPNSVGKGGGSAGTNIFLWDIRHND